MVRTAVSKCHDQDGGEGTGGRPGARQRWGGFWEQKGNTYIIAITFKCRAGSGWMVPDDHRLKAVRAIVQQLTHVVLTDKLAHLLSWHWEEFLIEKHGVRTKVIEGAHWH